MSAPHPYGHNAYVGTFNAEWMADEARSLRKGPMHQLPEVRWSDIAERLRNGEDIEAIAAEVQRTPHTIKTELSHRGWNPEGKVLPVTAPWSKSQHQGRSGPTGRGLRLLKPAPEFMDGGSCASTDPAVFYPEQGEEWSHGATKAAKRVCAGCPVRLQCLQYALDNDERFGIWGGLTPNQRTRMKRLGLSAKDSHQVTMPQDRTPRKKEAS